MAWALRSAAPPQASLSIAGKRHRPNQLKLGGKSLREFKWPQPQASPSVSAMTAPRKRITRPLDVGIVRGDLWKKRRFVEGVGIGLLADWMRSGTNKPPAHERTQIGRKRLRKALAKAVPRHCSLTVDGHELSQELLFVEVLNTRFIGPALPIGPASALGDRLLDVVYMLPEARSEMLSWLDNPDRNRFPFLVRQGRKIVVDWEQGPLHVDDRTFEGSQATQVTLKLEPRSLRVCAPHPQSKKEC
jgi:diacylglycerol kinase family enzyme